jgi:hypothetical protein
MAATLTAAGARDATRLEPLVCTICFLFFIYYTNVYFSFIQRVKTAMGAAATTAGARDATRLEPLVRFFVIFLIALMFILCPLNTSIRRWQQQ